MTPAQPANPTIQIRAVARIQIFCYYLRLVVISALKLQTLFQIIQSLKAYKI